jgi:ATP-dependent helicase/nuclease subunit B
LLIVTGMNEGLVPDTRIGDVFLPDGLRKRLGLRDDTLRLARDAYLMRACIAGRSRAVFIAGKTGERGDPLKPSRLLFRCSEEDLPARAEALFGDVREDRDSPPASISFRLDPSPPEDLPASKCDLRRLSVTDFRSYLACPFRFYLARVLGMASLDDSKREPDALDFGILAHDALDWMAGEATLRSTTDANLLAEALGQRAEALVAARFGSAPILPVRMMLYNARRRLRAAAEAEIASRHAGWEIVESERRYTLLLEGIEIIGQIDRVDRHRETGEWRIVDYKTSDKPVAPRDAHVISWRRNDDFACLSVDGKPRRWCDLQLPLYTALVEAELREAGWPRVAYFNLPKAVGDTGLIAWDGFSEALRASGLDCAREVVRRIRARQFWPPAEGIRYDDFETLIPDDPEAGFEVERLRAFMRDAGGGA